MQTSGETQVVVSGINRNLLKRGSLIVLVLGVVGTLVLFSMPAHYYFRAEKGGLALCKGRLWGFIGTPVENYGFIPVTAEGAKALVGQPYDTVEAALADLRPIVAEAAKEGLAAVAPLERKLAQAYETVLPNVQGARLLGIQGYDQRAEAMSQWFRTVTGKKLGLEAPH